MVGSTNGDVIMLKRGYNALGLKAVEGVEGVKSRLGQKEASGF
jgi:hypothetical protein